MFFFILYIDQRGNGRSSMRGIDGWMTCDFTSFLTVFQSYQDDGKVTMKGCLWLEGFLPSVQQITNSGPPN